MTILLFLTIVLSATGQETTSFKVIEPDQYRIAIERDSVQIVDVRTLKEYNDGYIDGAINVDFLSDSFLIKMQGFDKNKPLFIYCRSGNRSAKAAAKLTKSGFTEIIDLKGGYNAWMELEEKK